MADKTGAPRRRVPVILQQERGDCGAACLAMVAASHGRDESPDALRHLHDDAGRGVSLADLVNMADRLGLAARPLRLSLADLGKLRLPAVLHWQMSHFVVLVRCGRRRFVIHDPATGRRIVELAEMSEAFSGVALELSPATGFRQHRGRGQLTFRGFAGNFRHLYRYLAVMFCLSLSVQLLALAPPVATQILVDDLVLGQDRGWLYRALAGLALLMLAGVVLDGLRQHLGLFTGTRLALDSAVSVVRHLVRLPASFIGRRHAGDVLSRLDSLNPLRHALTEQVTDGVVQAMILLTTVGVMLLYSGWLTVVALAGLLLSVLIGGAVLPAIRRAQERSVVHAAAQDSSLLETLRGFEVVQALGLQSLRRLHWQNCLQAATAARYREGKLSIAQSVGSGVVGACEQVAFLAVGVTGVLEQQLTLGVLFAFMALRNRLAMAAAGLADTLQSLFLLRVHTRRLSDIVLADPVPRDPPGAVDRRVRGRIRARGLSFSYGDGPSIIRNFDCDIDCDIEAGSRTVITGPSGCGKTTLLKLLAGLLEPKAGNVWIDDIELPLWCRDSLRSQCGFVLQNDSLFQGSILDNIAAFDRQPDLARLRSAALAAAVWADIQALPMKLETLIGDMGSSLSGGQLQRIVLARALYREPALLFLDEATSHLDVETERRVLDAVDERGITVVSVAHRPAAIERADHGIRLAAPAGAVG